MNIIYKMTTMAIIMIMKVDNLGMDMDGRK